MDYELTIKVFFILTVGLNISSGLTSEKPPVPAASVSCDCSYTSSGLLVSVLIYHFITLILLVTCVYYFHKTLRHSRRLDGVSIPLLSTE